MKKLLITGLIAVLFSSCFGDKKSAIGTDFGDNSFVNKNFKGNKITYSEIAMDPCSYVSKSELAKLYGTSEDKIILIGANRMPKTCTIRVQLSEQEFDYITGSVHYFKDPNTLSDGTSWKESWQLQKGISKSAIWVPNMGKAAMYKSSKRELFVKFDDYTLSITAPGSSFNKTEQSQNRDYKKIALTMAKNTPLF